MKQILWGLAIFLADGIAAAGNAKSDLANLSKGSWTVEHDGKKAVMKFAKDTFTLSVNGEEIKGTFKIDPSKKPKHMDLTITYKCKEIEAQNVLAIYALDGDTLKWCAREPGSEPRPTAFPDKEGADNKQSYLIFKRSK